MKCPKCTSTQKCQAHYPAANEYTFKPEPLQPLGKCAECLRDLMEPYEVGAHGDKFCTGCYRYLTSEKNHGF